MIPIVRRWALLILAAAACGADAGPRPGEPASLVVHNRSQYALMELRLHPSPDYLKAENRLGGQPLAVEATHTVFGSGGWYLTVFREKNRGGKLLAFTTATPVVLFDDKGYKLEVFDESFRLGDAAHLKRSRTSSAAR